MAVRDIPWDRGQVARQTDENPLSTTDDSLVDGVSRIPLSITIPSQNDFDPKTGKRKRPSRICVGRTNVTA
jgi:hypothetical protein